MLSTSSTLPPVITLPKLPPAPPQPISEGPLGLRRMLVTDVNWDFDKRGTEMVMTGIHPGRPFQYSQIRTATDANGKTTFTLSPDPAVGAGQKLSTADLRDLARNLRSLPSDHPVRDTFAFGSFLSKIDAAIAQAKPVCSSRYVDAFEG